MITALQWNLRRRRNAIHVERSDTRASNVLIAGVQQKKKETIKGGAWTPQWWLSLYPVLHVSNNICQWAAWGQTLYKSRQRVCDDFRKMTVEERVNLISEVNECLLCLDCTRGHQHDAYWSSGQGGRPYPGCIRPVNGSLFVVKHHYLLHGSSNCICN